MLAEVVKTLRNMLGLHPETLAVVDGSVVDVCFGDAGGGQDVLIDVAGDAC